MTALADLLNDDARRKLLARLAELQSLDRLVREPGQQLPPDPPVPLAHTTERTTTP